MIDYDENIKIIIKRAKKLLEVGWIQDAKAKDKDGKITNLYSPAACKWNFLSAIDRAYQDAIDAGEIKGSYHNNAFKVVETLGFGSFYIAERWSNDPKRTLKEILKKLNKEN